MKLLEQKLMKDKKDLLYKEANMISSEYMDSFYNSKISLNGLATQLHMVDTFLKVRVWIVKPDGTIIVDTRMNGNAEGYNINDLNPDFLHNNTISELALKSISSIAKPVIDDTSGSAQYRKFILLKTIEKILQSYKTR
jgi:hypothetical protein